MNFTGPSVCRKSHVSSTRCRVYSSVLLCPGHGDHENYFPWYYRCNTLKRWYSVKEGTLFDSSRLPLRTSFTINFAWSRRHRSNAAVIEENGISRPTAVYWLNFIRDLCGYTIEDDLKRQKIGGVGMEEDIDETKLCIRKYPYGGLTAVQESTVVGVCGQTGECFIYTFAARNAETHVLTDRCVAYQNLKNLAYTPSTLNHSKHFKDPENRVHTNNIENWWRWPKSNLPTSGTQPEYIQSYIYRYLLRKK